MNEVISTEQKEILKRALKFLARREYSAFELSCKLKKFGFNSKDITSVLAYLKQKAWQSDLRFAENYFSFRAKRGFGPLKIAAELEARGITQELINQLMIQNSDLWISSALKEKIKKYGKSRPSSFQDQAHQMRFLQSRGFTLGQIKSVFK